MLRQRTLFMPVLIPVLIGVSVACEGAPVAPAVASDPADVLSSAALEGARHGLADALTRVVPALPAAVAAELTPPLRNLVRSAEAGDGRAVAAGAAALSARLELLGAVVEADARPDFDALLLLLASSLETAPAATP